jgi:hypothetical protein
MFLIGNLGICAVHLRRNPISLMFNVDARWANLEFKAITWPILKAVNDLYAKGKTSMLVQQ